ANEGALKIARLKTGRKGIIATMRGFHGRTMGALSATWEKNYREPFLPLIENIGAVFLEVVQGEGGVHPAQAGYLQAVQELAHANGSLLIIDEVQTGWGRTGSLFAHWQDAIQPDLVTVAKSMAGGIPMGAVLLSEKIGTLDPATHGSTFGGNPLACAAGLAALGEYTKINRQDAEDTPRPLTPSPLHEEGEQNTYIHREADGDLVRRARKLGDEVRMHLMD